MHRSPALVRTGLVAGLLAVTAALLLAVPAPPAEAAVPTERLAGASRIETAVAISQHAFPDGAEAVHLARADVFADALAAGALTRGPVLLVPSCGAVPPVVAEEVQRLAPDEVVALGGPAAVCDEPDFTSQEALLLDCPRGNLGALGTLDNEGAPRTVVLDCRETRPGPFDGDTTTVTVSGVLTEVAG